MIALAEKIGSSVVNRLTHKEQPQIFDPGKIAAQEIAWRTSESFDHAILLRAMLAWLRDSAYGLTQENAQTAAVEEFFALMAQTPEEKKLRYVRHFDAAKKGTSLQYDSAKAADILMKTNGRSYREDPAGFVIGVADLHMLIYGISAEKTPEMVKAAEDYGTAIQAMFITDYRSAEKSFKSFYTKLNSIILSSSPPQGNKEFYWAPSQKYKSL